MGLDVVKAQNGAVRLNNSVLTRMSRDCTAPPLVTSNVQSRLCSGIPYKHMSQQTKRSQGRTLPGQTRKSKGQNKKEVNSVVPAAYSVAKYASPAQYLSNGDNVIIKKREFVGSVTNGTTTGFALAGLSAVEPGYDLNPASAGMFPWLSGIACNFERFHFNSVKFTFIPAQATSVSGRFYAAIDYDYDDIPATSKQVLMSNRTAMESSVWQQVTLEADSRELHRDIPFKYVSLSGRNNFVEPRTAFCGYLMVAFDTPTANLSFDIWVEYSVVLSIPVMLSGNLQDSTTNSVSVSTSNVTSAVGTGFVAQPTLAALPAGPVKVVAGGTSSTPTFSIPFGGSYFVPPFGYDFGESKSNGWADFNYRFAVTGAAPSALIAGNQLVPGWAAFDSIGNYLGINTATYLNNTKVYGTDVASTLTTVDATGIATLGNALSVILAKWPTMRYIVPYLTANAALGAGSSLASLKYSQ